MSEDKHEDSPLIHHSLFDNEELKSMCKRLEAAGGDLALDSRHTEARLLYNTITALKEYLHLLEGQPTGYATVARVGVGLTEWDVGLALDFLTKNCSLNLELLEPGSVLRFAVSKGIAVVIKKVEDVLSVRLIKETTTSVEMEISEQLQQAKLANEKE